MTDVESASRLIDDWFAYRDMAARILTVSLQLDFPSDVLRPEYRGRHVLLGTGWCYRTHGIGVDMVRRNGKGGIDFDFSALPGQMYAHPDWWRLQIFMRRVVHDRHVDSRPYTQIIADPDGFESLVTSVLETRRP